MQLSKRQTLKTALFATVLGCAPLWGQNTVDLTALGAQPNNPNFNSRDVFQRAFSQLHGGGTVRLPAGDFWLHFPEIPRDVDPKDASKQALIKSSAPKQQNLLQVPANVTVEGAVDGSGRPATRLHWKISSVPVISFVNASGAGLRNLAFVYDGTQPQFFPYAQEDFLKAVGQKVRWLGGPYEISAVVYSIGSNNLRLENLTFQSSHPDNEHTFAMGIVLKGLPDIEAPSYSTVKQLAPGTRIPGGGIGTCASGNTIRGVHFEDYIMGILASAQCNLTIENVSGDHRGSWYRSLDPQHEPGGSAIKNIGPPGHLIYITLQSAYDVEGGGNDQRVFRSTTRNKNLRIENITEGPHTFSNFNSLGTLALKNIDGGTVRHVVSQHPAGLIQTMIDAHNLTLDDLQWSSDVNLCAQEQTQGNCAVPIIGLEPGPAESKELEINSGVHFSHVHLRSAARETTIKVSQENSSGALSRDITVDGLDVECNPYRQNNAPAAVVLMRVQGARYTGVSYTPIVSGGAGGGNVADAVEIQPRSSNASVDVTLHQSSGAPGDAYKCVVDQPTSGCNISRHQQ